MTPGALRLFVAADPPRPAVEALQRARRAVLDRGLRITPADQVHMTLVFLGPTPPERVGTIAEQIAARCAAAAPLTLRPLRLRSLPPRGQPRVLAAETDLPTELSGIQAALARDLSAEEPRPFLPHLTLARYRREERAGPVDAPLACEPFAVIALRLVRSELLPEGPAHTTVGEWPLGDPG
jgi:RNA 2',3'-cyclic 3'-phosphodiesterase